MPHSLDEVERLARQSLMSDPAVQEHFLNGLEPMLPTPLDLSKALVSYADLLTLKLPERPAYLPWLMEGGNVMVFGPRGVGKTFFQLGLTGALTTGGNLWSWQVKQPVGVLYIDGEMRIKELRDRLTALMNVPPAAPLEFLTSELVYQRCGGKDLVLTSDVMRQEVVKILDAHPAIKVLILDNISCLFSGINEDSKQDWEPINAADQCMVDSTPTPRTDYGLGASQRERGAAARYQWAGRLARYRDSVVEARRGGCPRRLSF